MKYLYILLIIYMMMAFVWWSVLLQRYNFENTQLKLELQELHIKNGTAPNSSTVDLENKYESKTFQIMGEAIVFGLTLMIGIFFLYRSSQKELFAARKQKNFLLSITHELKSPLASINLILETFKRRALPQDKIDELSTDALSESKRLEDLFNKILIATKVGSSNQYFFEENNLSTFIQNIVEQFKRSHSSVDIDSNIQPDIFYQFDHEAITSILMNLLENAYKYSPKERKEINIILKENHNKISLSVVDNGSGIPDLEKKKVFDQFYRMGDEETRKAKGTGLGLYIVDQLVKAHKGKILIKNNNPSGCIFEISLNKNI